jgi:hypothetical protein
MEINKKQFNNSSLKIKNKKNIFCTLWYHDSLKILLPIMTIIMKFIKNIKK